MRFIVVCGNPECREEYYAQTEDRVARDGRFNTAVRLDRILEYLKAAPGSASCAAGLDRLIAQ